jgi:hypothetical protein
VRWLLVLLAACRVYDPVAEVPHDHREVRDAAAAIELILAENPAPRVYAIGEYHVTRPGIANSSLTRFTEEILGLLEPRARHLVIEAWDPSRCSPGVTSDIAAGTSRPKATQMEILRLVTRARPTLDTQLLPMTCLEHDALRDAHRNINYLLLLELVTEKLHDTVLALLAADPSHAVIVYGGALHNDLYPRWPLEELSYAQPLARELGGGVLEIDLVVPEVVAPMGMVRDEPWFPLLARASPDRAIVWQRGPASYVVILPAQSEQVARVAQLPDVM